jgi:ATP-binding cassette subfamily C protein
VPEEHPGTVERKPTGSSPETAAEKTIVRKLYEIFTPQERMQALLIFFAGLITAFAQMAGVFSVFPFINVAMDPASIQDSPWLTLAYTAFSFSSPREFMAALGIAVVLLVILSNGITALTMWAKTRFVLNRNYTLSNRLLAVYLSRPYAFFLINNTSDLGKNVLSEINQLTSSFLMPLFEAMINILILVVIVFMLFSVNPAVTLVTLGFLGTVYGTLNYFLKVKLKQKGAERMEANKKTVPRSHRSPLQHQDQQGHRCGVLLSGPVRREFQKIRGPQRVRESGGAAALLPHGEHRLRRAHPLRCPCPRPWR